MAVAWAPEWALVREWEEWPWCDFLPLAALCLWLVADVGRILTPPVSTVSLYGPMHAERPRLPMVPMGASDDPAGIERSRQDGAVRKVIEWSAHKGLVGVVERHNFHFRVGRTHLLKRRRP